MFVLKLSGIQRNIIHFMNIFIYLSVIIHPFPFEESILNIFFKILKVFVKLYQIVQYFLCRCINTLNLNQTYYFSLNKKNNWILICKKNNSLKVNQLQIFQPTFSKQQKGNVLFLFKYNFYVDICHGLKDFILSK